MKTIKLFLSILVMFLFMSNITTQNICANPPSCIQNSTLNGGGVGGDLNTSPGSTVPGWFTSHGSPSYSAAGTLWIWSKGNFPSGEGVFSCYNFIANQTYEICLSARWDNSGQAWNQSGTMNLFATNGLNINSTVTTAQTNIGTTPMTSTLWTTYTYTFTPTNSFNQLWIYPTLPNSAAVGNQFNLMIDNIIVKDITPPTVTNSNGTYSIAGGPLTGGAWNWSTIPATSSGTGTSYTPTPPASGSLIVNAVYVDPCAGGCRTTLTYSDTIFADTCDDVCYWRVTGNNIYGTNNKFGTVTNNDVDIITGTGGAYRGVITRTGEWGMGSGLNAGNINAKLHVDNSQWGQGHIDASGTYPSVRLYQNSPSLGNPVARLGLATSPGGWTSNSSAGDVILQNTSRVNSLIFGTNVNSTGTNGLERMRIDESGQVGINMPNSTSSPYNPSAYLHVACQGGNSDLGGTISDVRFEQLEPGQGTLLVIDANGYVYNSGKAYTPGNNSNDWRVNGNTNGALSYIGTNDNFDFPFHTNGTQKMNLTTSGALQVGNNPGSVGTANLSVGNLNIISNNSGSNLVSGSRNTLTRTVTSVVGGQNNVVSDPNGGSISKSVALGWANQVQTHNQYLIGAANTASPTSEYSGVFGVALNVSQRGAWYLGGTAGSNLTNNSTNSLAIGWRTRHTALFNQDGLSLGTSTANITNNNDLATARLDVNTASFTSISGALRPSGVRFRNLPTNEGMIVVRQDNGYIFESEFHISVLHNMQKNIEQEQEKSEELMEQVNELSKKLEELAEKMEKLDGVKVNEDQSEFKIFPNPNSGNFMIKHFIPMNSKVAYLVITSQDGKEIMKKEISCVGLCTSSVNLTQDLDNGTYICTLFIDGEFKTSDRFVFTR